MIISTKEAFKIQPNTTKASSNRRLKYIKIGLFQAFLILFLFTETLFAAAVNFNPSSGGAVDAMGVAFNWNCVIEATEETSGSGSLMIVIDDSASFEDETGRALLDLQKHLFDHLSSSLEEGEDYMVGVSGFLGGLDPHDGYTIEGTRKEQLFVPADRLKTLFAGKSHEVFLKEELANNNPTYHRSPLVPTLYHLLKYYRGDITTGPSIAETANSFQNSLARKAGTFGGTSLRPVSPLQESPDGKHNIVIFTDGQYNSIQGVVEEYRNYFTTNNLKNGRAAGHRMCSEDGDEMAAEYVARGKTKYHTCMQDLGAGLHQNDLFPLEEGVQNVNITMIVYGDLNERQQHQLGNLTEKNGGKLVFSENISELKQYIDATLIPSLWGGIDFEELNGPQVVSAPAISVNSLYKMSHDRDIYYSIFQPSLYPIWQGNLKKYELSPSGAIVDKNGNEAIDPSTGQFKPNAKSFWSNTNDGGDISVGGAANRMPLPERRKLLTDLNIGQPLSAAINKFAPENKALVNAIEPHVETSDKAEDIIRWAQGVDLKDENEDKSTSDQRLTIQDSVNSEPVVVTYGGTVKSPKKIVFQVTNGGFLHAFDADDGKEKFAFIPQELLKNLPKFYANKRFTKHIYGLDGPMTVWVQDLDNNGIINGQDKVYLYLTMRRGGNNIYALDVTNINSPRILWRVKGGTGNFAKLGQTWSRLVKTKVRASSDTTSDPKDVLIFTGGYEAEIDDEVGNFENTLGNAVYVVDANNGDLLAKINKDDNSNMQYSMPGGIRVIDVTGNGLADQAYAADTGGQVWRFDFYTESTGNQISMQANIIGKFGKNGSNARSFYNTPTIAVMNKASGRKLAVAIGSGHLGKPLSTDINDRFYVIHLDFVTQGLPENFSFNVLTDDDLINVSSNVESFPSDAKGWYIDMKADGEKVLGNASFYNNTIYFSSYTPPDVDSLVCGEVPKTALLYGVSIFDGEGRMNPENKTIKSVPTNVSGVPPELKIIKLKNDGGAPDDPLHTNSLCNGIECIPIDPPPGLTPTYWRRL